MTFESAVGLVLMLVVVPVVIATLYYAVKMVLWDMPKKAWDRRSKAFRDEQL